MDFAKSYLSVVCDDFEQPEDILSWRKLKKRNSEFKNQGLIHSLGGVYDEAKRLGVLGMGDFKLILNSSYSETSLLVISENYDSLYSEVAWWFKGFSFRN
jgi:hypothetical protein